MIMKELKILFFHIPKTGGTSIKGVFEKVTPCWIPEWHMRKEDFKKILPDYDDYFKFSFVRNPWDRIVSIFHFRRDNIKKIEKNKNFKDWVLYNKNTNEIDVLSQLNYLNEELNFIGKFENFEEDLKKIFSIFNLNLPKIPKLNQSKHDHFLKYYDKESANIVKKWSEKDCEFFNYNFPYLFL